jgi:hypothetical protein
VIVGSLIIPAACAFLVVNVGDGSMRVEPVPWIAPPPRPMEWRG